MVMKYEVTAVNGGVVTVSYDDGSWAEVPLFPDMTPDQVDAVILAFGPKNYAVPTFVSVGYERTLTGVQDGGSVSADAPDLSSPDSSMDWFQKRVEAYGTPEAQLEFITEHGLAAWQEYVANVKTTHPKE
jgi:hypothetical protein